MIWREASFEEVRIDGFVDDRLLGCGEDWRQDELAGDALGDQNHFRNT